jgi:hypothetical protein
VSSNLTFGKRRREKKMALSNWDTLSVDHNSNPINGTIRSKMGVQVDIYKNWLYINDEIAWREGAYIKPIVMEIQSGDLIYKDVTIYAERGPQNGVYCVVYTPSHLNEAKGEGPNAMIGIGCYGYIGEDWIGVHSKSVDFLIDIVKSRINDLPWSYKGILDNLNFKNALRFNQGDAYFANKLKFDIPTSKPEEAEKSILMRYEGI